ncbi:hypothetical protein D3C75_875190 [compost metagenome]
MPSHGSLSPLAGEKRCRQAGDQLAARSADHPGGTSDARRICSVAACFRGRFPPLSADGGAGFSLMLHLCHAGHRYPAEYDLGRRSLLYADALERHIVRNLPAASVMAGQSANLSPPAALRRLRRSSGAAVYGQPIA